jgi:hypothetical protein
MSAEESTLPGVHEVPECADNCRVLEANGCSVVEAAYTGRFAPCVDLYLAMVDKQLTYDALRILGGGLAMLGAIAQEMVFLGDLGKVGKIAQGRFIASKN